MSDDNENDAAATAPSTRNPPSRLSVVSQQYEVEGKGYLTDGQLLLRKLDTDGDGKLDPHELVPLLEIHQSLKRDNAQLRTNQWLLGGTTILLGLLTIIATIVAIREAKDTIISTDGALQSKSTGQPIITQSRGVSIISQLHPITINDEEDYETTTPNNNKKYQECANMEDVATLYKAFGDGSDVRILTNDALLHEAVTEEAEAEVAEAAGGAAAASLTYPVRKVGGASAFINDTHVVIGDVTVDITAENTCNRQVGGRKYPTGPRKLFHDHVHGRQLQQEQEQEQEQEQAFTGTPTEEEEKQQKKTSRYDAVIIGAGWSGIGAAAKLIQEGMTNILLLEARDYIGGRSKTVYGFAPAAPETPFELGSEFIYTNYPNAVLTIFQQQQLRYQPVDFSSASFVDTEIFNDAQQDYSSSVLLDDTSNGRLYNRLWTKGFVPYLTQNSRPNTGYGTLLADFETEEDITDAFEQDYLEADLNWHVVIEMAADADRVSTAQTQEWITTIDQGSGENGQAAGMAVTSVPGGGYGNAIQSVVTDYGLEHYTVFGADVQRVVRRRGNSNGNTNSHQEFVQIDYLKDGVLSSVEALTVLVTVPLGVLKSEDGIQFEPELPPYKQTAIDEMQMGVLDKLIMYWDEETMVQSPNFAAVWDEVADKEWYNLVTPDDATSTVWTAFSNSRRYNGLYTMTAWIGGSAAETMETQERASNEASIVEEVVANLRTMFATDVVSPTKYMLTDWWSDPYSRGSYSYKSVGTDYTKLAKQLARSIDNTLFFAGEHTNANGWGGTVTGAYDTGETMGSAMSKALSGDFLVAISYEMS